MSLEIKDSIARGGMFNNKVNTYFTFPLYLSKQIITLFAKRKNIQVNFGQQLYKDVTQHLVLSSLIRVSICKYL